MYQVPTNNEYKENAFASNLNEYLKRHKVLAWCQDCVLDAFSLSILQSHSLFMCWENCYKLPSSKDFLCICGVSTAFIWITCFAWPPHLKSFQILSENFNPQVFSSICWSKLLDCYQTVHLYSKYFVTLDFTCIYEVQSTGRRGKITLNLCLVGFKRNLLLVAVV